MNIPIAGWVGKIAKIDKLIPDELLTLLKTQGKNLSNQLSAKSRNAQLRVLQQCAELLQIFTKGRQAIKEFFTKLADDIGEWFVKNQKSFKLVEKVDNAILVYVRILKSNSGYVKCIELVKRGRVLGRWIAIESEAMVKLYTSSAFIRLNNALRGVNGAKLDKELKAMQKILDDALARLPNFRQGNQPLQRSAYFTEQEIKKIFKVGKDFTDKGFMSTTHSEQALTQWLIDNPSHNVVFKVFGNNGKLIEKASMLPHEAEVLFKSGTTFVVESVNKGARHPLDKSKKIVEIILKEK